MPTLARVLREDFPDIDFDFRGEMLVPDQVAALLAGTLDLAFLRPPVGEPGVDIRVLRSEPLIAALPESHPLAARPMVRLEELRDENFICYPGHGRSVMYDAVLDACQRAGFQPRQIHEVAETSTLVVFVAAGLGVALVSEPVQELRVTGATFRPLAGEVEQVEIAVATRSGDDSPHLARVLARVLQLGTTETSA